MTNHGTARNIRNGYKALTIQPIKQFTNGMTESEEAAVILSENDNEIITHIWERMVKHLHHQRSHEYGIGSKVLKRDQADTRARVVECSLILSTVAGKAAAFWQIAGKQTVGFHYVTGWDKRAAW